MDFEYFTHATEPVARMPNGCAIRFSCAVMATTPNTKCAHRFRSPTDGNGALAILPVAALLTGSVLTLGVGVLLVVVLAVRRKADPQSRTGGGDDKAKHLGRLRGFGGYAQNVYQVVVFFLCVASSRNRYGHDGDRTAGHGHRTATVCGRVHAEAGHREAAGHFECPAEG